jgi:hypothetical protein
MLVLGVAGLFAFIMWELKVEHPVFRYEFII